jgi:hypothetical protein
MQIYKIIKDDVAKAMSGISYPVLACSASSHIGAGVDHVCNGIA